MRVATYSQPAIAARGSVIALILLVLTVVMGSSALHTLMTHFAPALHSLIALMWLSMYLAAFLGLMFSHGINWISWLSRYRILLVILLVGTTISVAWSIDAVVSAERVIHLLGCSILAIYLGFMIPLLTTLRVTAVVLGIIMIASLAAALGMPSVGMQSYEGKIVWSGIMNSKNTLGFWAAISVLLYIALSSSSNTLTMKFICYVMALLSLALLVKSESATSLLAMLLAGALSLYLYIAFRFQLGFIRMVVLAVLFGGLTAFAISNINTAEIVGRSGDLTGRGEVWRQTWLLIMERPLTGYGYGSIWFPNDATLWIQQSLTDFTWVVFHAHNGFLQVASEIGLPLSCIALLMVAQQLIEIFYCQYERQQVGVLFVLAFVVAYLVSNFSEARFLVTRELFWIFFLALPISMLRQINLVSVDEAEEEEGPYNIGPGGAYANVPPDKPWLRPINQTAAAQIAGGAAAQQATTYPRIKMDSSDEGAADNDVELPYLKIDGNASYDIGDDETHNDNIDVANQDVSDVGDHTIDTTQAIDEEFLADVAASQPDSSEVKDYADNTLEYDDVDHMDKTLEFHPDDYKDSVAKEEQKIRPYEVFDNDSEPRLDTYNDEFIIDENADETGIDSDRYDKKLGDDLNGDDDEWVDISLGDRKP